jgi:hypothetical protein
MHCGREKPRLASVVIEVSENPAASLAVAGAGAALVVDVGMGVGAPAAAGVLGGAPNRRELWEPVLGVGAEEEEEGAEEEEVAEEEVGRLSSASSPLPSNILAASGKSFSARKGMACSPTEEMRVFGYWRATLHRKQIRILASQIK